MRIDWIKVIELAGQGRDVQERSRRDFAPTSKQMLRQAEQEIVQAIKAEFKKGK